MNRARRSVQFERKPSQRYSRRPNFESVRDRDKDKTVTVADNDKKFVTSFLCLVCFVDVNVAW